MGEVVAMLTEEESDDRMTEYAYACAYQVLYALFEGDRGSRVARSRSLFEGNIMAVHSGNAEVAVGPAGDRVPMQAIIMAAAVLDTQDILE